ncbi:hypothetical protein FB567DRAFT_147720 [Paraphoma chrysanthemicola]|uniref:GPI inositol-deacylase n=1 Tax=Paraphoma chrysanthemicola TaxID=798071 RepID=A0A8K0VV59_9PLEO|nr:hypothetical protein FB567DRAFT_147720 [Paraphoma chrysanthemicola]
MDRLRKRFSSKSKGRDQNGKPAKSTAPRPQQLDDQVNDLSIQENEYEKDNRVPDTVAGAQQALSGRLSPGQHEDTEIRQKSSGSTSPGFSDEDYFQSSAVVTSGRPSDAERRRSSTLSVPPTSVGYERRRSSNQSTPSNFVSVNSGNRARSNSEHRRMNPLGLTVIHEPERGHSLDIVLVHGLGGSSHSTWSKDHDPAYFWPHLWLPTEPAIDSARILSFGYDADWKSTGSKTVLNITDFAKELLFAMKFTKDENRNLEDLGLGDVPIIFIVHSMGGLVVKKAYILGQTDDEYSDMVKSVNAIIFLSTPHRGSNLAELLNRILSASVLRYSPKQYITDLQKNSPALEEINEQFRKFAPKLHIVSFYETLETTIGPKKVRILEKESAILGYPGEISRAMNADHHDVCKFYSPRDVNYISMRDVLKTLVDRVRVVGMGFRRSSSASSDASEAVETLLSVHDRPDDDYNFFYDQRMSGTCGWILHERAFQDWLEDTAHSSVLWLHALPASGKSVLSSFIINHVKMQGQICQYYYFRFGEQAKRTINGCLRSIAFQLSQDIPQFRRRMRDLAEDGLRLEKTDARTVWKRLFVTPLLTLRQNITLYWIIDALDEADSPQLLLDLLEDLRGSKVSIKVLVTSRNTAGLSLGFDQLSELVPTDILPLLSKSQQDVGAYVQSRMLLPRWDNAFKQEISAIILQRAEGNFLWVHLALKDILKRHTSEAVRQALENMPAGMEAMYHRMAVEVAKDLGSTDKELARRILTWAMYSRRALTLRELEEALRPSFGRILDVRNTISATCGLFVVVDVSEHVTMIHQTARDYLTHTQALDLFIDAQRVHIDLFSHCMTCLMDTNVRGKLTQTNSELKRDFIQYAATSWSYHLGLIKQISPAAVTMLVQFLRGPHVLTWIRILASLRHLKVLVYASRTLTELLSSKRKARFDVALDDNQKDLLRLWAVDFVKLVGKFGPTLSYDPASIHNFIPEFCPQTSMVHRQFTKQKSFRFISVSGITNDEWDDSIAHMSDRKYQLSKILCSRGHVAAIAIDHRAKGVTLIWSSTNFEKRLSLPQEEYITASCFDATGTRYLSCGVSHTKLWEIPSGRLILTAASPVDTTVLGVAFSEDRTRILAASEDKSIHVLSLESLQPEWQLLNSLDESDVTGLGHANSPCAMVFNADSTQIAVAYRGFPLSVWSVEDRRLIGRCSRQVEGRGINETIWAGVDTVSWNTRSGHLLGKYSDGCVFKWDPYERTSDELRTPASLVHCSPDGLSFATCDNSGVIRLFNFQSFALLYQLRCDAPPRAFAFSPDSRRFYEIREGVCTAWEPPALTDLQETGDQSEELWETQSDISTLIDAVQTVEQEDRVTSLAVASDGKYFCAGDEVGEIHLFDAAGNKVLKIWSSPRFMIIEMLAFDQSGKRLAFAELGGDVSVKQLSPPSGTSDLKKWTVQSLLQVRTTPQMGVARQLLFSPDGRLLLVVRQYAVQVWSLETGKMTCQYQQEEEVRQHWICEPENATSLLVFDQHGVKRMLWETLTAGPLLRIEEENIELETNFTKPNPQSVESPVQASSIATPLSDPTYQSINAYLAQDQSHIIVERTTTQGSTIYTLFKVADLPTIPWPTTHEQQAPHAALITNKTNTRTIPASIAKCIEVSLGLLTRDVFVFLDQDFWLCTWKIDTPAPHEPAHPPASTTTRSASRSARGDTDKAGIVRKHFMLPRHWLNKETLPLLHLTEAGRLFCPKGAEVAVIGTQLGTRMGSTW